MCFILKECGTFIEAGEDLPTNGSRINKIQTLHEVRTTVPCRWQNMVSISVWLEWKLGENATEVGETGM